MAERKPKGWAKKSVDLRVRQGGVLLQRLGEAKRRPKGRERRSQPDEDITHLDVPADPPTVMQGYFFLTTPYLIKKVLCGGVVILLCPM